MLSKAAKESACKTLAQRVAPMYQAANWKWRGRKVTEQMIYKEALELLNCLSLWEETGECSTATGGLIARRWLDEEEGVKYSIELHVVEDLDWHEYLTQGEVLC